MNNTSKRHTSYVRTLLLDFRRSVCSFRFLIGIISMLVWMIVNISYLLINYSIALESGTVTLLRMALDGSNMGPVLLVIATVPFATTYLTEKKSGFKEEMQKRIGIYIYSISKAVATFLSAILLAFISIILFLCILTLLKVPHIPPSEAMTGYYEELSITRDVEVYYALKMIITSLVCGFAAVFALFISSCISNAYVAVLSPMIGYYLWHCLLSLTYYLLPSSMIWPMISPINLFFGQVWLGSNLFSFLWTTLFLTLVTAFFGICFVRKSCKEAIE